MKLGLLEGKAGLVDPLKPHGEYKRTQSLESGIPHLNVVSVKDLVYKMTMVALLFKILAKFHNYF